MLTELRRNNTISFSRLFGYVIRVNLYLIAKLKNFYHLRVACTYLHIGPGVCIFSCIYLNQQWWKFYWLEVFKGYFPVAEYGRHLLFCWQINFSVSGWPKWSTHTISRFSLFIYINMLTYIKLDLILHFLYLNIYIFIYIISYNTFV